MQRLIEDKYLSTPATRKCCYRYRKTFFTFQRLSFSTLYHVVVIPRENKRLFRALCYQVRPAKDDFHSQRSRAREKQKRLRFLVLSRCHHLSARKVSENYLLKYWAMFCCRNFHPKKERKLTESSTNHADVTRNLFVRRTARWKRQQKMIKNKWTWHKYFFIWRWWCRSIHSSPRYLLSDLFHPRSQQSFKMVLFRQHEPICFLDP